MALGRAALASLFAGIGSAKGMGIAGEAAAGPPLRTPINSVRFCCCSCARYPGYLWSADFPFIVMVKVATCGRRPNEMELDRGAGC